MELLLVLLIVITLIQLFLTMRKHSHLNHIGELTQVNELMGYIDRKEMHLTDEYGKNALMIASGSHFYTKKGEFGFEDVINNAINSGVDLNERNPRNGKTALMYALHNKDNSHMTQLLLSAGANVNIADNTGRLPLFDSIKTGSHYKEIVALTDDINHQDDFGVSALMIAAYHMDFAVIDDLLERAINGRLKTNGGDTAHEIARKHMNRHIQVAIETAHDDEFGKPSTITTSKDVLEAQKHNHKVRETVRKLACYENGEDYVEKKFKRPLFKTGKAN